MTLQHSLISLTVIKILHENKGPILPPLYIQRSNTTLTQSLTQSHLFVIETLHVNKELIPPPLATYNAVHRTMSNQIKLITNLDLFLFLLSDLGDLERDRLRSLEWKCRRDHSVIENKPSSNALIELHINLLPGTLKAHHFALRLTGNDITGISILSKLDIYLLPRSLLFPRLRRSRDLLLRLSLLPGLLPLE